MSLINTEIKPFTATAFQNGEFVDVTRRRPARASGRSSSSTRPTSPSSAPPSSATWPTTTPTSRRSASRSTRRLDRHPLHPQGVARHLRHDRQDRVPDDRRPDRHDHAATSTCSARARAWPTAAPSSSTPTASSSSLEITAEGIGRNAAELLRKVKAAQYVARPPGRGLPGQVGRGRRHPRPRRWTSSARSDPPAHRPPRPRRLDRGSARRATFDAGRTAASDPSVPRRSHATETAMLDANLDRPAQDPPREDHPAHRARRLARRQPQVGRARRAARRDRRALRAASRSAGPTTTSAGRRSPSTGSAPTSRCASPASRSATSSPRSCSPCSRSAATRPRRRPRLIEQIEELEGELPLRDLLLAVLPELPRRRAGAQPDERPQPEHHPHRDRRRAVPGRGRRPPGHGRADRVPQRRAVRPGPHEPRADRRQARHRRRRARWPTAIAEKDPFDVLVVGGGPAGAAAAIYAARKGIRTGVAAERFGGQVLDTMAIENFISVPYTEGPKLAAALEQHVKEYDVDVMNLQRATKLVPADEAGGLVTVELENGASLRSRTVVLSHRRPLAPDERARRGRVPQQGRHLLPALRRPAVQGQARRGDRRRQLRRRGRHRPGRRRRPRHPHRVRRPCSGPTRCCSASCAACPTSTVIVSALTTEVRGRRRQGHRPRLRGPHHRRGPPRSTSTASSCRSACCRTPSGSRATVELSPRGEIVIDDRGQTSVPGVFAAGDCTTVPYKQIVIAMGAGSTAALSAFDHLIRTSAPAAEASDASGSLRTRSPSLAAGAGLRRPCARERARPLPSEGP